MKYLIWDVVDQGVDILTWISVVSNIYMIGRIPRLSSMMQEDYLAFTWWRGNRSLLIFRILVISNSLLFRETAFSGLLEVWIIHRVNSGMLGII